MNYVKSIRDIDNPNAGGTFTYKGRRLTETSPGSGLFNVDPWGEFSESPIHEGMFSTKERK